jgi:hypothetical protein
MCNASAGQLQQSLSLERFALLPEATLTGGPVHVGSYHVASKMTAHQVQDYIDKLVAQVDVLGELYVARQLDWAVVELGRVGGRV